MPIFQFITAGALYVIAFRTNGFSGLVNVSLGIILTESIIILRRYRGVGFPVDSRERGLSDYIYIWMGKPLYNAKPPKNEKKHSILATFLVGQGVSLSTTFRIYHFFRRAFGYPYNWRCQNCKLEVSSTSYKELNSIQLAHILDEKDKETHDSRPGS